MKQSTQRPFRILTLDGGGAKGFYTLGVLIELEAMLGGKLSEHFDLVYGTSTGSIISSLIGLGVSVPDILGLYREHVMKVVAATNAKNKSSALAKLATTVFGDQYFSKFETDIGIVTANWANEKPMIFKSNVAQAHGRVATFVPGFGCKIADAVQASCSAYPFFNRKFVTTQSGDKLELVDGGYCANNPTLFAIADASEAFGVAQDLIRVVSIGVGHYPAPKAPFFSKMRWAKYLESVELLQKTLEINTQSMDQLRRVLYKDVQCIRISDTFIKPELATDLFECNSDKLNAIHLCGKGSFASMETQLGELMRK